MTSVAGRILIVPRGDYDAAASYEPLDLVFQDDASWLCKAECTGQTPADGSTYWFRFSPTISTPSAKTYKNGVYFLNGDAPFNTRAANDYLEIRIQDGYAAFSFDLTLASSMTQAQAQTGLKLANPGNRLPNMGSAQTMVFPAVSGTEIVWVKFYTSGTTFTCTTVNATADLASGAVLHGQVVLPVRS